MKLKLQCFLMFLLLSISLFFSEKANAQIDIGIISKITDSWLQNTVLSIIDYDDAKPKPKCNQKVESSCPQDINIGCVCTPVAPGQDGAFYTKADVKILIEEYDTVQIDSIKNSFINYKSTLDSLLNILILKRQETTLIPNTLTNNDISILDFVFLFILNEKMFYIDLISQFK